MDIERIHEINYALKTKVPIREMVARAHLPESTPAEELSNLERIFEDIFNQPESGRFGAISEYTGWYEKAEGPEDMSVRSRKVAIDDTLAIRFTLGFLQAGEDGISEFRAAIVGPQPVSGAFGKIALKNDPGTLAVLSSDDFTDSEQYAEAIDTFKNLHKAVFQESSDGFRNI